MIPLNPHPHRARVDRDGNIILPREESAAEEVWVEVAERTADASVDNAWRVLGNDVRSRVFAVTTIAIEETRDQYRQSWLDVRGWLRSLHSFLSQPVWVPRRKKGPKERSRGTLFFIDTVRFGGTFAAIFSALFIAMNAQSFLEIVFSYLHPLQRLMVAKSLESVLEDSSFHAKAEGTTNDLLSILPRVGPPENRLVIPALGLNVPIVNPPITSLLAEDWAQMEKDIQAGLQNGVVHYPGTAVPDNHLGNVFLTGHSSYYAWSPGKFKTVFARLHQLKVGDEYWIYFTGDKHRYRVVEKKEVSPSDISVLDQPTDRRLSTLMTCTPVGTTLRRLAVVAEEVDLVTGIALKAGETTKTAELPKVRPEMLPI